LSKKELLCMQEVIANTVEYLMQTGFKSEQ
jgi:hypothetical protein